MRRFTAIFAAVAACLGAMAASAPAAVPQLLGQNATAEGELGGCICSVAQFADTGTNPYLIPGNGVLTKTQVWVGKKTEAGDTVQARTFSTTGPSTAKAISGGEAHSLNGLLTGQHLFYDRIPAAAGDVLGARFHDSPLTEETPARFKTAAAGDLVGVASSPADPALGQPFGASVFPNWRVNIRAVYESDEDADGYGDVSQDLCLGSPVGGGPCSGLLFGSPLSGEHGYSFACGYACLRVQTSIGGASTASPFAGVVVRWRLLAGSTGSYRIRTVAPAGGGNYTVVGSSSSEAVTTEPQLTEKIYSFATRVPIPAGGYVGLAPPPAFGAGAGAGAGATLVDLNDHAVDGVIDTEVTQTPMELFYDADIEPDADRDGYGDVTQDSCPGTATVHDGQCPVIDVFPPPSTPKITGLKVVPTSFRVKAKGASAKLTLKLSDAATVAFGIEAKKVCGGKGKGKKARCKPGFHAVQTITQKLPGGQDSVLYSARLRSRGKEVPLTPGAYRVTAVPTAGGVAGKATQATFKVLPPRHRAGH
jgi:hypothetical protein